MLCARLLWYDAYQFLEKTYIRNISVVYSKRNPQEFIFAMPEIYLAEHR